MPYSVVLTLFEITFPNQRRGPERLSAILSGPLVFWLSLLNDECEIDSLLVEPDVAVTVSV